MNPNLITIGNFSIKWYSFLLLIAFSIGYYMVVKESERFKVNHEFVFNLIFYTIVFSLIGARLYYVVFNYSAFKNDFMEIFRIWNGGLAIHGGIIAGIMTIYFYTKKHKEKTILFYDFMVVPLLLGQAIGRWGNFFNSEAHGVATTLEHLQSLHIPEFIINGMKINGVYYTPTFFYESIWCLLGFIIVLIIRRKSFIKIGDITGMYLMWYSFGRFFIEQSRTDSLMFLGFKVAQLVSIILFIIGGIILISNRRKEKYDNLYNDINDIKVDRI